MDGESSLTGAATPSAVAPERTARTGGSAPGHAPTTSSPFPRPGASSPPALRPPPDEVGSLVWAASPLVTVGMAAGPCFAYAAVRHRSRAFAGAAVVYAGASVAVVWNNIVHPGSLFGLDAGVAAVLGLWTVSSVHALAVRRRVFRAPVQDEAVTAAKDRIRRRDEARRLVARDPGLARELGIGRPDQPSDYDDGGLIDVNHVPGECLRLRGGLDAAVVRTIIATREKVGRFDGRHDLEILAGLDPDTLDEVADRLIFCR
jgi:hypothetical protein